MPNSRISQLPYVGNTGYTSTDIIPFVNYIDPSGTTSNTTLLEHKSWILSGLSSSYLPLSGGTVFGPTIFTSGVTANTISATTYQNLPTDIRVTGATYSNNTFTYTNNTGGTFNVNFNTVTGLTVNGNLTVTGTTNLTTVSASTLTNVNYIDFNLTANPSHQEGRIHWNDDTKTLEVDTENSNVQIEVGHENVVRVVNNTGAPLLKGTIVYIDGAQGGRPTVTKASYEGDNSSARTLGFIAADINSGSNGYVITYGILLNVNTLAYSAGTPIFLFTGGTYTNIRPIAPLHEVRLGYIVSQNATTGSIFVNVMNGYELTELHDVSATTVNNLDILQWNSSQSVWQPTSNPRFNSISATTYQNLPLGSIETSGTTLYSTNPSTSDFSTNNSIFLGSGAGSGATGAVESNFIGNNSGQGATDAQNSNFIGNSAGVQATGATGSNFIGSSAGNGATNSYTSNFIGANAGQSATDANSSNFIGLSAGESATNAVSSNFIGRSAGVNATNANNSNFLGESAGDGATNANYSNFFGYGVGRTFVGNNVGSNNIIIGTNISLPDGVTNSINLGGVLFGKNTYSTTNGDPSITAQGGNIGINVVNPSEALHVSGNTLIQGNLTATTISATTYQNLPTDIRVTGATYSNNTFTYTNNTGGTFNVNFNTVTGLTINGNLDVTGNYVVSGNTIISGTTVYSGDVTYNSNATVGGILTGAYASPYIQIGSSYTATSVDSTIEVTGGTFTLILPNANQKIGKQLYIKNDGTGIVTISGSTAGQTIDGFSQRKLAKYEELLIQSDGSSNWIILNKKAHTILFGHEWTTGSAPTDSTTYYIGNFLTQQASTTQVASRQVIAMSSGWATDVSLMVSVAGTLGTSEDSTLTLRNVTTATNSTITTTLEHNVVAQLLNFTLSSPLQITKGDVLEIQWLTPNWGTNPAAVRHVAQVLLN